jgi:TolB-like protein/class 3 adenylate cyclase/Tfp pilus assembly protein PilF
VSPQDTPAEPTPDLQLEIAHILLIDVVGYSRLLVNEQIELLQELKEIVRSTECFRAAEARGELIRVPTGDGMALVFFHSPEEPARCALEISKALQEHPSMQLRMGVHSGPINRVTDVNEKTNIAGSGINVAQRVLDCGDAGHILLSAHVAEDLAEYRHWQPNLHDLGECEVKYGLHLHLFNLYKDGLGNPRVPEKLKPGKRWKQAAVPVRPITAPRWPKVVLAMALVVSAVAVVISSLIFFNRAPTTATRAPVPGAPAAGALAPIPEKSIAVLPFQNLSDQKENAYFADGVQDEILTHLGQVADLKVISRTSVMQYKNVGTRNLREIAEQLGVAHVLEGSVQRAGNRVRVTAQLINARTDANLWAERYDRDLADVFAIQSEIAKAIAEQLQAKLSPNEKAAIEKPPTTDLAAFDLYTRAKTLLLSLSASTQQNLQQAVELLNQAVARDPAFFEAYYQLVYAQGWAYSVYGDHTPARLALAEAALQAATRLRPDAGETHLARANYLYYCLRDYNGALAELEAARRSLPNDPRIFELSGYILRRRGQQEEGVRNLERAVELDPRNPFMLQQLAVSYQQLRRYPEEAAVLDRALTIVPNDVGTKTFRVGVDFLWKAETRPLHETIDSILAGGPSAISDAAADWFLCALAERDPTAAERALVAAGDNPCWTDNTVNLSRNFGEGLLARMMKDEGRAHAAFRKARLEQEKIVQVQPDYGPALCVLGLIDASLGRKEEALGEGRRAIELLPVEKDSLNGSQMLIYFAIIAAWAGEKDTALQYLAANGQSQGGYIVATYGALKLLPFWDPLRGDPRFEQIVASLAPKDAASPGK